MLPIIFQLLKIFRFFRIEAARLLATCTDMKWLHSLHCELQRASVARTQTALTLCFTSIWQTLIEWTVKDWQREIHQLLKLKCVEPWFTYGTQHYFIPFTWIWSCYLGGFWVTAWLFTSFAPSLQLCNLKSEGKVGVGAAPGTRVTPLYHSRIDFTDPHLVRFYCEGLQKKASWQQRRKGNNKSH